MQRYNASSPTTGATWPPGVTAWSASTATACCPSPGGVRRRPSRRCSDGSRPTPPRPTQAMLALDFAGGDRGGRRTSSTRSNLYVTEQAPWKCSPRTRRRSRGCHDRALRRSARRCARSRCCYHAGDAEGHDRAVGAARRRRRARLAPTSASRRGSLGPAARRAPRSTKGATAVPAPRGTRAGVTDGPTRARGGPAKGTRERPPLPEPLRIAGDRHPLPPRHRRRRREATGSSSTRRWPRRRRSASRASCRSAATCRARAGRSRRAAGTTTLVAAVALHPNEAPRIGGRSSRRLRRRRYAEIAALAGDRGRRAVGRDRARLLPHRRGRPRRPGGVVPRAHRARRSGSDKALVIHDRDAHDDVLRVLEDEGAARAASSSTASPATPRWPRTATERGWYLLLRRHRDVQERDRRCARRWRSCRSTGCWSRPTRRTSRRCRTAGGRTRRTWCRSPCA